MTTRAKAILRAALSRTLPTRLYCRLLAWRIGYFEPELKLLRWLCDRRRIAVDVGASNGSYTAHLLARCAGCVSFEPRADAAGYLQERLAEVAGERLRCEAVALSDRRGRTMLRVLEDEPGRSSLQEENPIEGLGNVRKQPVPVRRLDDFADLREVCLVKIDVEGHEEAVLRGATRLLRREQPALIIEMEERHNPGTIGRVTRLLDEQGYQGYFLHEKKLHPVAEFDAARFQPKNGDGVYLNNFIFLPPARQNALGHLMAPRNASHRSRAA